MGNNTFWKTYWSAKTNGQHRSQAEEFLANEAKEKLFHLAGGNSILDFGCGSADLLAYYAQVYSVCVGTDGSALMLEKAKERLQQFGLQDKVLLGVADDAYVWPYVDANVGRGFLFDRITAGQVIQYLTKKQVNDFVSNSQKHLSSNGKLCLFDVVDSRTYELWLAGLFGRERMSISVIAKFFVGRFRAAWNKLRGKPTNVFGHAYPPSLFIDLANKHGLKVSIIHSMYYEYRYHVLFEQSSR